MQLFCKVLCGSCRRLKKIPVNLFKKFERFFGSIVMKVISNGEQVIINNLNITTAQVIGEK